MAKTAMTIKDMIPIDNIISLACLSACGPFGSKTKSGSQPVNTVVMVKNKANKAHFNFMEIPLSKKLMHMKIS